MLLQPRVSGKKYSFENGVKLKWGNVSQRKVPAMNVLNGYLIPRKDSKEKKSTLRLNSLKTLSFLPRILENPEFLGRIPGFLKFLVGILCSWILDFSKNFRSRSLCGFTLSQIFHKIMLKRV